MKKNIIIVFVFLICLKIQAQEFAEPTYQGTGCPEGSVGLSITPDKKSIALLFDNYQVQVPQFDNENDNAQMTDARTRTTRITNDPALEHKACALSLQALIPSNLHVTALEVSFDSRGFALLDQGVQGSFSATLIPYDSVTRRAQSLKVIERKLWRTNLQGIDDDWYSNPKVLIPVTSHCGSSNQELRFDIKTHLNIEILNRDLSKQGLVTVDSNDINSGLQIKLHTSPCPSGSRMSPPTPPRRRYR